MLADVLRALCVTGAGIPEGLPARAALYRSMLVGRRILLVLDDAAHADQVRPLLPPTGGCAVVITSRRRLASMVGGERVAREPDEADGILRSCGHLPLAIRIAGGKLAGRPAWSLRVLNERLEDWGKRTALRGLAQVHSYRDDLAHVTDHMRRSMDLCVAAGDKLGLGRAMAG